MGTEEAELGEVEGVVPLAVGEGGIAASAAEVAGLEDRRGAELRRPVLTAVRGPVELGPTIDVVVRRRHRDPVVELVVDDLGLVLRHRRVGVLAVYLHVVERAGLAGREKELARGVAVRPGLAPEVPGSR